MNQNDTYYVPNTQYNGEYSSESASYDGQYTQFDRGTAVIDERMHNLGLGNQDRAGQDGRDWNVQRRDGVVTLSCLTTSSRYMDHSPTASERSEYNSNEQRDQSRDSGYAEKDASRISLISDSLSVEVIANQSSAFRCTITNVLQTNPYQNEASIWQDGRASTNKLHCRILKLDTQCEKSNWVSAQLVNDLGAITTTLEHPQSFMTAGGEIMTADLETTLTFRFDRQVAALPQTRFFVASTTDFSFDIILGWEDATRYRLLSLPTFYAIAHRIQNRGKLIRKDRYP